MSELSLREAREVLVGLAASLPSQAGEVRLSARDDLVRVTVHNPHARGALAAQMMVQLADAVAALHAEPPAIALLEGSGGSFCSGGHLGEVRGGLGSRGVARTLAAAMSTVLDALQRAPCLVVGWVDGPAVGGGWELATAVDLLVVGPDARFSFRQPALGVAAGWGGAPRLVRRVGAPQAMSWLATAAEVDARAARDSGLADVRLDAAAELDAALAPMRAIPAAALRAVKRQVDAAARGLGAGPQHDAFASVWGGADHRRAMGLGPADE